MQSMDKTYGVTIFDKADRKTFESIVHAPNAEMAKNEARGDFPSRYYTVKDAVELKLVEGGQVYDGLMYVNA